MIHTAPGGSQAPNAQSKSSTKATHLRTVLVGLPQGSGVPAGVGSEEGAGTPSCSCGPITCSSSGKLRQTMQMNT